MCEINLKTKLFQKNGGLPAKSQLDKKTLLSYKEMNYLFRRGNVVSIDTEKLQSLSFEAALQHLESIVEKLSNAEANLDELLQMYEDGIAYLNHCQSRLADAEAKIKVLSNQLPGAKSTEENNG